MGPYLSDVDEIGCRKDGKMCPAVLVMGPRLETTK
jgi:hypothetical protein